MKQILLLGDYKLATWHPLRNVDNELTRILDEYNITICEDYPVLIFETLKEYDMIINYIDNWEKRGNADCAGALIAYVAAGGSMMTLHNGIIAKNHPELEQLMCASFTHHPKHQVLKYTIAASHPLTKKLKAFEMDEEPYMFQKSTLAEPDVLMEFEFDGMKYPAVWIRNFGKGKMIYIAPGHNQDSFKNDGMELLIREAALWCCNELDFPQDNVFTKD